MPLNFLHLPASSFRTVFIICYFFHLVTVNLFSIFFKCHQQAYCKTQTPIYLQVSYYLKTRIYFELKSKDTIPWLKHCLLLQVIIVLIGIYDKNSKTIEFLQIYCTVAFDIMNKQGSFYMMQTKMQLIIQNLSKLVILIPVNSVFSLLRLPCNEMTVNLV